MIHSGNRSTGRWTLALAFLVLAAATVCGSATARAQTLLYGIGGTDTGSGPDATAYTLFSFQSNAPGAITPYGTVTPTTGYALESIAFQPGSGTLYGLEYSSAQGAGQLVTINPFNATVTTVGGTFSFSGLNNNVNAGNSASISFNRQTGMLQLVTGGKGNYTVNPTTGALTTNGSLAYAAGDANASNGFQIASVAFTNNTLYAVDYVNNTVATQNVATGVLSTVGSNGLGLIASGGAATEGLTFPASGTVLYLSTSTKTSGVLQDRFYSVNAVTGVSTNIGVIGASTTFNTVDIAAYTLGTTIIPEPGTAVLCVAGAGLLGAGMVRGRLASRGNRIKSRGAV